MAQNKALYRLPDKGLFGGVIAGIAEYLDIDASIARLLFLFITLATGIVPGVITYIVMLIILPTPVQGSSSQPNSATKKTISNTNDPHPSPDTTSRNIIGGGFIVLGLWYLLAVLSVIPGPELHTIAPILLIIFGVLLLKK